MAAHNSLIFSNKTSRPPSHCLYAQDDAVTEGNQSNDMVQSRINTFNLQLSVTAYAAGVYNGILIQTEINLSDCTFIFFVNIDSSDSVMCCFNLGDLHVGDSATDNYPQQPSLH